MEEDKYYYCIDYDRYVRESKGIFYVIKNGIEEANMYYIGIWFNDIFTNDISKEEYYARINKSLDYDVKSTQRSKG